MSLKLGDVLIAGAIPAPTGAMNYKDSVLQVNLPTSGQVKGDYYSLTDVAPSIYAGQCAIWNGTEWKYSSSALTVDTALSTTSTNPVENKAITTAISGRLPLSGGTMTGSITALSNTDFGIHAADNSTYLGLSGSDGNSAYNGCVLFLTGKDQADWHGGFGIRTGNGVAAESKTFSGHPNGELKWNNKRVDAMTISTTGLSVSGVGGFTATINAQRCIDHELYYEYYIIISISGTFSTAYQELVCNITGLQGTQLYTHEPCAVWCEGGKGTEQALFYGNQVYIGACPTSPNEDRRVKIHTIRMK